MTIRVLRTHGPNKGNVETVDFRTYVGWVLSTEWTAHYPLEALKVGAIAVKQYAWYYTIVYRGGVDASGNCYDVVDNTNDQYYDPDNKVHPRPGPNKFHLQAIAATWNISLRKWSKDTGSSRLLSDRLPIGKERRMWRGSRPVPALPAQHLSMRHAAQQSLVRTDPADLPQPEP